MPVVFSLGCCWPTRCTFSGVTHVNVWSTSAWSSHGRVCSNRGHHRHQLSVGSRGGHWIFSNPGTALRQNNLKRYFLCITFLSVLTTCSCYENEDENSIFYHWKDLLRILQVFWVLCFEFATTLTLTGLFFDSNPSIFIRLVCFWFCFRFGTHTHMAMSLGVIDCDTAKKWTFCTKKSVACLWRPPVTSTLSAIGAVVGGRGGGWWWGMGSGPPSGVTNRNWGREVSTAGGSWYGPVLTPADRGQVSSLKLI